MADGVIGDCLARWEAKHRKPGAPEGNQNAAASCGETTGSGTSDCSDERDHTQARGILRRLHKRAQAGDNQHTLKEGGLDIVQTSVNGGGGNSATYLAARLKKAGRDDLLAEKGADTGSGCRFGASIRLEAHEIGPSEVHTYQPQSRRRARQQDRQR